MANEAFPECVLIKNGDKITLAFETEADASVGFDAIERLVDALSSDAVAGGKPVASGWMNAYGAFTTIEETAKAWAADGHDVTPLVASSELDQLRDRVKELDKALEPFVGYPEFVDTNKWPDDGIVKVENGSTRLLTLTVGDLRTARRVREGGKVDG